MDNEAPGPAEQDSTPSPIPRAGNPHRFQAARSNFSRFARSGGTNHDRLKRAVHDYVRSGTRGSKNATRRMGASRTAASGLLAIIRDIRRDGLDATLRAINLGHLAGRAAVEIFLGVTDIICADGGPIDEGIARDAWLETITELDTITVVDLNALTTTQVEEIFLRFLANTIETRLFQDIGANGLRVADDLSTVDSFEVQFKEYIYRGVRDAFAGDLSGLAILSDADIKMRVDETYKNAWELLESWGGHEE